MYLFGPVPSRRLGLSLGVDLLNCKTCNLNCVYCELGRTPKLTLDRKVFVPVEEVMAELKDFFAKGGKCDHVTFSGAGEPTLALNLGRAIDETRKITKAKIALLTNGMLFFDPQVRKEAAKADVVMPNIDAVSDEAFKKINRPAPGSDINKMLDGLRKFSGEYPGKLYIELMVVAGINDSDEEILKVKEYLHSLPHLDKIQVNTVVRARAEDFANPVKEEKLQHIKELLGSKAEVIGKYTGGKVETIDSIRAAIVNALRLRPMTIEDVLQVVNAGDKEITAAVKKLLAEGKIEKKKHQDKDFYVGK